MDHIIHVPGGPQEFNFGPGSALAVEIFFMISGFYMALILGEKYTGNKSLRYFYKNRFLRIYPAYLFVLAAWLLISISLRLEKGHWVFLSDAVAMFSRSDWFTRLHASVANFFLLGQDSLFLLRSCQDGSLGLGCAAQGALPPWMMLAVPQAWSIEVEMLFYLLCPLLVRLRTNVLAAVAFLLLAAKLYVLGVIPPGAYWAIRFPPFELALFCLGILAYRVYRDYLKKRAGGPFMSMMAALFFSFLLFCRFIHSDVAQMAVTYMVAFAAMPYVFRLSRNNRADRFVGDLSYPIYLVHEAVAQMVVYWYAGSHAVMVALVATVLASMLLNQVILRPIEAFRGFKGVPDKPYAMQVARDM